MSLALILQMIVQNRKAILYSIAIATVAGIVWYFGFHVPAQLEDQKKVTAEWKDKAETAENTVKLNDNINKGKEIIDAKTQTQISTIHNTPMPHKRVIIQSGRVLPRLH